MSLDKALFTTWLLLLRCLLSRYVVKSVLRASNLRRIRDKSQKGCLKVIYLPSNVEIKKGKTRVIYESERPLEVLADAWCHKIQCGSTYQGAVRKYHRRWRILRASWSVLSAGSL